MSIIGFIIVVIMSSISIFLNLKMLLSDKKIMKTPWFVKIEKDLKSDSKGYLYVIIKINKFWITLQYIKYFFIVLKDVKIKINFNRKERK